MQRTRRAAASDKDGDELESGKEKRASAHPVGLIPLLFLCVGGFFVYSTVVAAPAASVGPGAVLSGGGGGSLGAEAAALRSLVREQNATIQLLAQKLARAGRPPAAGRAAAAVDPRLDEALAAREVAVAEVGAAHAETRRCQRDAAGAAASAAAPVAAATDAAAAAAAPSPAAAPATAFDAECDAKFGAGLVASYRASRHTVCGGGGSSKIECFSHTYAHNGKVGRFCVGENVVVDFSKVSGAHTTAKPKRGAAMYHGFERGALAGDCERTAAWRERDFMPHSQPMFRSLGGGDGGHDAEEAGVTYLMARDEDCENMFHSTADFLNAYVVGETLRDDRRRWRTVLFDRHPNGPFYEMIERVFSAAGPLRRAADFGRRRIRFERVVFHLESPAGIVFPKVGGPKGVMPCRASPLWLGYRTAVLRAFDLLDVPPPALPHVLLSVRRRTPAKNTGRVFEDEASLAGVLREGAAMTSEVVDLGSLTFRDQLARVRRTTVLVGAHGAGLMHVIFAADEAVLLEIHPSYRLDRHFRLAARMAGKVYVPMRSTKAVTCRGSSDAIPVDAAEFRSALDAALRVARSFRSGVAECGLACDSRILALDDAARGSLPAGARPFPTRFPCG